MNPKIWLMNIKFQDVRTGVSGSSTFLIIHFTEPPTKDDREGRVVEMIKQAPAPGTFTQGEKRSQAQLQSFWTLLPRQWWAVLTRERWWDSGQSSYKALPNVAVICVHLVCGQSTSLALALHPSNGGGLCELRREQSWHSRHVCENTTLCWDEPIVRQCSRAAQVRNNTVRTAVITVERHIRQKRRTTFTIFQIGSWRTAVGVSFTVPRFRWLQGCGRILTGVPVPELWSGKIFIYPLPVLSQFFFLHIFRIS